MSRPVMVLLNEIDSDEDYQPRIDGLDETYIAELEESGADTWPPLAVVKRNGRYLLVDGWHRLDAARKAGHTEIDVEVHPVPDNGDLRGFAFTLNRGHGRRLTNKDRNAEVERLLRKGSDLSSRQIATRCGRSHNTVEKIRRDLEATGQIDQSNVRVGGDGKRRPATSSKPPDGTASAPSTKSEAGSRSTTSLSEHRTPASIASPDLEVLTKLTGEIVDYLEERNWTDDLAADDFTGALITALNGGRYTAPDLHKVASLLRIAAEAFRRAGNNCDSDAHQSKEVAA